MKPLWDIRPEIRRLGFRLAEVVCDWNFEMHGTWLCVHSGFRFDGASIPIPLWLVIAFPFAPWVWVAALIHDWFYRYHNLEIAWVMDGDHYRPVTRAEADRAFYHVLIAEINRIYAGDSARMRIRRARRLWRARAMHQAVRKFAGAVWDRA